MRRSQASLAPEAKPRRRTSPAVALLAQGSLRRVTLCLGAVLLLVGCGKEDRSRVIALEPQRTASGAVQVDYILKDRDESRMQVEASYAEAPAGAYYRASPTADNPVAAHKGSASGRQYRFLWDAQKDVGPVGGKEYRLRLRILDDEDARAGQTRPFRIADLPLARADQPPGSASASGSSPAATAVAAPTAATATAAAPSAAASAAGLPTGRPITDVLSGGVGPAASAPGSAQTAGPMVFAADSAGNIHRIETTSGVDQGQVASLGARVLALASAGGVLVAAAEDRRLYAITSGGGISATLDLPGLPGDLALSPDGRTLGVTVSDRDVCLFASTQGLVRLAEVPTGREPVGLALFQGQAGLTAYVANRAEGSLSVIQVAGGVLLATVPVGGRPGDVAVFQQGFVTDETSAYVTVLETVGHSVVNAYAVGGAATRIGAGLAGNLAFFVLPGDRQIASLDVFTGQRGPTIQTQGAPQAVAVVGGTTLVIGTAQGLELATITGGAARPAQAAVSAISAVAGD